MGVLIAKQLSLTVIYGFRNIDQLYRFDKYNYKNNIMQKLVLQV